MSVLHVRQIERYLREKYESEWRAELDTDHNLSRLLALHAAVMVLGLEHGDDRARFEVTDGEKDRGIDALGIDLATNRVAAVQSKWRGDGTGSVSLAAMLRFTSGARALLDIDESRMPQCTPEMQNATRSALETPGAKLHLVVASTAAESLSADVAEPLDDLLEVLNAGVDIPIAEGHVLLQSAVHQSLTAPARVPVDLSLNLLNWGQLHEPAVAYYGRVSAFDAATWLSTHGSSLFDENLRVVLPKSDINAGLQRTLIEDPARFWYYNNGITVLAREISRAPVGSLGQDAIQLELRGASVVNGAQTVSAAAALLGSANESHLRTAYVNIRCIQVSPGEDELGRLITRYANTQNVVSAQDFAFLDPTQHRLRTELRADGFEYVLRAGESPTDVAPQKVIHIRDAAVAIACGSGQLANAMLAKREVSRLFDYETGPYRHLFNPSTHGRYIHRTVSIFREIEGALASYANSTSGPSAGIAANGLQFVAFVCFQEIRSSKLADADSNVDEEIATAGVRALTVLRRLIEVFPDNAYPATLFKNTSRCEDLIDRLNGVERQAPEPQPTLFD